MSLPSRTELAKFARLSEDVRKALGPSFKGDYQRALGPLLKNLDNVERMRGQVKLSGLEERLRNAGENERRRKALVRAISDATVTQQVPRFIPRAASSEDIASLREEARAQTALLEGLYEHGLHQAEQADRRETRLFRLTVASFLVAAAGVAWAIIATIT